MAEQPTEEDDAPKLNVSELVEKLWSVVEEGKEKEIKKFFSAVGDRELPLNDDNEFYEEDGGHILIFCVKEGISRGNSFGRDFIQCARILVENDNVDLDIQDKAQRTALHLAVIAKHAGFCSVLMNGGADPTIEDHDGFSPFHIAVQKGYKDLIKILTNGQDKEIFSRKDGKGTPPIVTAVNSGNIEICRILLENGAKVDATDRKLKRSALQYAVLSKRLDIFDLLLKYNPSLDQSDYRGKTALHQICSIKDPRYFQRVLKLYGSFPDHIMEQETVDGITPVIAACQNGNSEQLKELIEQGASIVAKDDNGRTALHYCADNLETQCAEMLLAKDSSLLEIKDSQGFTPLHMSVISGNAPLLKLLLKKGADIRSLDNELHTPTHWATVCGHLEILDILVDGGAELSSADSHNAYPIHYAAQMNGKENGHSDPKVGDKVLKKLLDSGVPHDVTDKDGRTPLLWAASAGNTESIKLLVKSGADVNAIDKDGLSALHCAASRGHHSCIDELQKLGADVNLADKNSCTPIFYAITLGNKECTKSLLKHGANPNHKDVRGRTPGHCASVKGCVETVKLLDKGKADLWNQSSRGDCPIHEAAQGGHCDVVKYLLKWKNAPDAVNTPNNAGRTCLHIAAIVNNLPLCKLLLDNGAERNAVMTHKDKSYTPYDAAILKENNETAEYIKAKGGKSGGDIENILKKEKRQESKSAKSRKSANLESHKEEDETEVENKSSDKQKEDNVVPVDAEDKNEEKPKSKKELEKEKKEQEKAKKLEEKQKNEEEKKQKEEEKKRKEEEEKLQKEEEKKQKEEEKKRKEEEEKLKNEEEKKQLEEEKKQKEEKEKKQEEEEQQKKEEEAKKQEEENKNKAEEKKQKSSASKNKDSENDNSDLAKTAAVATAAVANKNSDKKDKKEVEEKVVEDQSKDKSEKDNQSTSKTDGGDDSDVKKTAAVAVSSEQTDKKDVKKSNKKEEEKKKKEEEKLKKEEEKKKKKEEEIQRKEEEKRKKEEEKKRQEEEKQRIAKEKQRKEEEKGKKENTPTQNQKSETEKQTLPTEPDSADSNLEKAAVAAAVSASDKSDKKSKSKDKSKDKEQEKAEKKNEKVEDTKEELESDEEVVVIKGKKVIRKKKGYIKDKEAEKARKEAEEAKKDAVKAHQEAELAKAEAEKARLEKEKAEGEQKKISKDPKSIKGAKGKGNKKDDKALIAGAALLKEKDKKKKKSQKTIQEEDEEEEIDETTKESSLEAEKAKLEADRSRQQAEKDREEAEKAEAEAERLKKEAASIAGTGKGKQKVKEEEQGTQKSSKNTNEINQKSASSAKSTKTNKELSKSAKTVKDNILENGNINDSSQEKGRKDNEEQRAESNTDDASDTIVKNSSRKSADIDRSSENDRVDSGVHTQGSEADEDEKGKVNKTVLSVKGKNSEKKKGKDNKKLDKPKNSQKENKKEITSKEKKQKDSKEIENLKQSEILSSRSDEEIVVPLVSSTDKQKRTDEFEEKENKVPSRDSGRPTTGDKNEFQDNTSSGKSREQIGQIQNNTTSIDSGRPTTRDKNEFQEVELKTPPNRDKHNSQQLASTPKSNNRQSPALSQHHSPIEQETDRSLSAGSPPLIKKPPIKDAFVVTPNSKATHTDDDNEFEFPDNSHENEEAALKLALSKKQSREIPETTTDLPERPSRNKLRSSKVSGSGKIHPGLREKSRENSQSRSRSRTPVITNNENLENEYDNNDSDEARSTSPEDDDDVITDINFQNRLRKFQRAELLARNKKRERYLLQQLIKTRKNNKKSLAPIKSKGGADITLSDMEQHDTTMRSKKNVPKRVSSIQESVRRYQDQRRFVRQMHQLKRAQIYTGPMHDIVLFSKMMDIYKHSTPGESEADLETSVYENWDGYLRDQLRFVSHYYDEDRSVRDETNKVRRETAEARRGVESRSEYLAHAIRQKEEQDLKSRQDIDGRISAITKKTEDLYDSVKEKAQLSLKDAREVNSHLDDYYRRERSEVINHSRPHSVRRLKEEQEMDERRHMFEENEKLRKDKHKEWHRRKDDELRNRLMKVYGNGPTNGLPPNGKSRNLGPMKSSTPRTQSQATNSPSSRPKSMLSSISGSRAQYSNIDQELSVQMTEFGLRRVKKMDDGSYGGHSTDTDAKSLLFHKSGTLSANWTPKFDGDVRPRAGLVFVEPKIYNEFLREESQLRKQTAMFARSRSTNINTLEDDTTVLETIES